MITHQVLNDIKQSLSSPKLASQLVSDYQKELTELGWNQQQLALYFALLPNTEVTAQGDDWQITMTGQEQTLESALEAILKDAKRPVATDKLVQQLKAFNTSGPQLIAIAKVHPNMNSIGGRAISLK
ncbi:hypothetical protein [Psychromonas sp.]|uniref:hypothetical protein n=1 Tax=Psychromonas sp. TaxID=1884585 RepID=UPI003568F710